MPTRKPAKQPTATPQATRRHLHEPMTLGERAADAVASGMGSWRYIIIQTAFIIVWMALNTVGIVRHWDAPPFILLNLIFSIQASYAAPILQLSGNRQAQKDRARDDLEAREVASLVSMNRQQLEILRLLHQIANGQAAQPVDADAATTPPTPTPRRRKR